MVFISTICKLECLFFQPFDGCISSHSKCHIIQTYQGFKVNIQYLNKWKYMRRASSHVSYQMEGLMFRTYTSKMLSQQSQTHLKYSEIKSNKTFLPCMNRVKRWWQSWGRAAGDGQSSLLELCTDAGERRWHWIQWLPLGESPPCLWWMDRLPSSAGAPQYRRTHTQMLPKDERNIRVELGEEKKTNVCEGGRERARGETD